MAHIEFNGAMAVVMAMLFAASVLYGFYITSKAFTLINTIKKQKRKITALKSENNHLAFRLQLLRGKQDV